MTATPWGFRDILPEEAQAREEIALTVKGYFREHHYLPVETPLLEDKGSLEEGGRIADTPFKLFDDDGRLLVVRPDNTLPIVRLVSTRMRAADLPLRLRYEAPVVRECQRNAGGSRQFTQLGFELIGAGDTAGDVEIVSLVAEAVRKLALPDARIIAGSVRPFKELLAACEDRELEALEREITLAARMAQDTGLRIKSFYMGGGTPTTLTAEQMDRLLTRLERSFDFTSLAESTIEAGRPDTIDPEKLAVLRAHGVTRVSVNPQTMEDRVLAAIGRRHTADDIRRAMREVMATGFPHVNMDLIAGLPEDTPEGFRRSLDEVLSMGADNITVHTLSLKKGSRITLEGSRIPSADEVAEMLDYADPTLRKHGFEPYYLYRQKYMSGSFENVGWTRPGGEGLYNIYIMEELHSILSLGAGGSTKMVGGGLIRRAFNAKYPREYIDLAEKRSANLAAFADFYREPEEHT